MCFITHTLQILLKNFINVFQLVGQLDQAYPIIAYTKERQKLGKHSFNETENILAGTRDKAIQYDKGSVQIIGYGLPSTSFDTQHVSLLNPSLSSNSEMVTPSYVLDLDKMIPMQGTLINICTPCKLSEFNIYLLYPTKMQNQNVFPTNSNFYKHFFMVRFEK